MGQTVRTRTLDPRLGNIAPILSIGHMTEQQSGRYERIDPAVLKRHVASFGWKPTFWKLARLAAVMANGQRNDARELTSDLLVRFESSPNPAERQIAAYVAAHGNRSPVAHEAGIYFLQALALLYGNESDDAPPDGTLAFWFLLANDYALEWRDADKTPLTLKERILADTTRCIGFNQRRDPVRHFVRMYLTLTTPPPRTPEWKVAAAWSEFLQSALGASLHDYVEGLAAPLVIHSKLWGGNRGRSEVPVLNPSSWLGDTIGSSKSGEAFLDQLTLDRDRVVELLREGLPENGLPVGPSVFYRYPFVRFSPDAIVAASPWVVDEQLRAALWGKCISYAKQVDSRSGAQRWNSAFGDLFEMYGRRCVEQARRCEQFRETVHVSAEIGTDDEIEDIVIMDHDRVALVSFKASTIPEATMKQASCRNDVVKWFERWLFFREGSSGTGGGHRDGALRLLNKKIDRLRAGDYEPTIPRGWQVFPVVVTYDELGADNIGMYRWVDERCRTEALLQQKRVRRPTFAHINEFEELLAMAGNGRRVLDVLQRKTKSNQAAEAPLAVLIRQVCRDERHLRLRGLSEEFESLSDRIAMRLFGRTR